MKFGTNMRRVCQLLAAACASAAGAGAASAAITIATVPVGNVGNAADTTGYGSVGYSYNIGEYDVTATQYTAFLNAVAGTDTYGLYNSGMATASFASCGISQSGGPGSYSYATTKNGDFPMNYVSWGDAARFCNWLTNNQPTGAEGIGTTETGSYTLNGVTSPAALSAITRNAGADYVIPTENEWYKAAYYNPSSSGYYRFPTRSNTPPSNVLSATGTSNANYNNNAQYTDPINYLTPVGAFAASPSSYGTFDQGGDVFQWNETSLLSPLVSPTGDVRSGAFYNFFGVGNLASDTRVAYGAIVGSTLEDAYVGFRVSQVPEPASVGILGLGVMGILVLRRGGRR